MIFLVILGLIIAIIAILFAFQNSALIVISFGAWQFEESLAIVLLITLGIGIIISLLLSLPTIIKRGWITSRQKNKITELQEQVSYQKQEFVKQLEYGKYLKKNQQDILNACSLTDSVTEFLNQEATLQLIDYLLQQIRTRVGNSDYSSLAIFVLNFEPTKSHHDIDTKEWEHSIHRAIAKRLTKAITPNSFLGVSNDQHFICLTLSLTGQKVTEYAEYIIGQITASSLQKVDGTTMALKAFLGGAIADPADQVNSQSFFQQAEQNLTIAKEQKRKSIIITEIINY